MTFRETEVRVGALKIPLSWLARAGAPTEAVVVSPNQCRFFVTRMTTGKGSITLDLSADTNR